MEKFQKTTIIYIKIDHFFSLFSAPPGRPQKGSKMAVFGPPEVKTPDLAKKRRFRPIFVYHFFGQNPGLMGIYSD